MNKNVLNLLLGQIFTGKKYFFVKQINCALT